MDDVDAPMGSSGQARGVNGNRNSVSVYTVEEAAKLLRIGRSAAYEAVRRGEIPALRLGRRLRIPRKALEELLDHAGSVRRAL